VQRREVRNVIPGGLSHGRSVAVCSPEIRARETPDSDERVLFVRKDVAGKGTAPTAALSALGEGQGEDDEFPLLAHEGAANQSLGHPERPGPTPSTLDPIQVGLDQSQILEIDGPRKFAMVDR